MRSDSSRNGRSSSASIGASSGRAVRNPVVVDGRGALAPEPMAALGFDYSAFGRGVRAGSGTEEIEAERVGTGRAVQESGVAAIDAYAPLRVD